MKKETLKIKTSWEEVTLQEYLKISEVELNEELSENPIAKSLKFISILSNKSEEEVLSMDQGMFATLLEKISFIMLSDVIPNPIEKPFKVGDIDYIFHPNFNELTAGEIISIQTVCNDAVSDNRSFLPEILSILIRPCIFVENKEFKTTRAEIEKFDLKNLEARKDLFIKELKVPFFVEHLKAFMSGANRSKIISSLSSVRKNHLEGQLKEIGRILKKNH